MSDHADKAAEHAQHAGSHLSRGKASVSSNSPEGQIALAQVEATLSLAQRQADVAEAIREGIDALRAK